MLCTVKLSRRLFPGEHRHNLDAVIARHGLTCTARHRALGDAEVLVGFLAQVRERFAPDELAPVLDELLRLAENLVENAIKWCEAKTEYHIQKALDKLMKGRTSFVIAQRISTVMHADQILVLDKGRIVARGQHADLMETSEIYAEIYNSQLVSDVEIEAADADALEVA